MLGKMYKPNISIPQKTIEHQYTSIMRKMQEKHSVKLDFVRSPKKQSKNVKFLHLVLHRNFA